MSPLESATEQLYAQIAAYAPGTGKAPAVGTADYYVLRALVIGHAYLLRIDALKIEADVAACERLYRAGTVHFSKAAVPEAQAVVKEVLTPEQEAAVASAIASGNL